MGVLVLTDSALGFYPCRVRQQGGCAVDKGKSVWTEPAHFVIALTGVQSLESSSRVRNASAGDRLLIGSLASDRPQNFITVAHETAASAEAPMFRTEVTQAGALDAKIRFRMKKLGRPLEP